MKKFALNAVAVAALGLASSVAFAAFNLDASPQTGAITYASELNYSTTGTPLTPTTITTKLGFGVSANQNRYIRVDLTNATLAATASTGPTNATNAFVSSNLVAGGQVGDAYAIYQVTANASTGSTAADAITVTLPNVAVPSNAASVNVTYSLYETATTAVANATGTQLYQNAGAPVKFSAGLKWTLTPANNTALVTTTFKKFTTGAIVPVALGNFIYGVNTVKIADGATNVALSNLVTAATAATFAGDFTAAAASGLFYDNNDACGTVNALTLNAGKTSAPLTLGTTAKTANLCYTVTGTTVVPVESITAALAVVAATGSAAASVNAATIGTIDHDGTTLATPYANSAYVNRFVFTNSSGATAAWTATITTESGVACTTGTTTGTLALGTTVIDATSLVSACTGSPRFSVTFNIAAPRQYIDGVYTTADKLSNAAVSAIRLTGPVTAAGTN